MDTLTQDPKLELARGEPAVQFLPPESPMPMSRQPLHDPRRRADDTKAAPASMALRRAVIFAGTAVHDNGRLLRDVRRPQGRRRDDPGMDGADSVRAAVRMDCALVHRPRWPGLRSLLFERKIRSASIPMRPCRRSMAGMRCCCLPIMKSRTGSWRACWRYASRLIAPDMEQFDWFVLSDSTEPFALDCGREMLPAAAPRSGRR